MKVLRLVGWRSIAAAGLAMFAAQAMAQQTLLLGQPAISKDRLAFVYAGDLWVAHRDGMNPQRLTSHPASEFNPQFSPDGQWIAYSAGYDSNVDVYVISVNGGQPKRLTWHPRVDLVSGWSTDGKRVLFSSPREVNNGRSNQLYEVSVEGGFEKKVMEAHAFEGVWSADGKKLAYRPYRKGHAGGAGWRQNRGGSTPPIWIIDPVAGGWEKIPHVNASDYSPQWAGADVIFISDRNDGAANVFRYSSATKALTQLTKENVWDAKSVNVHGQSAVYDAGGRIKEIDLATGAIKEIVVSIAPQAIQARPQWKDASQITTSARLSATGKRVVVSARGDVYTVPVKDGSVRNLTATSGVREKDGLWSPDGKRVAYLSDGGQLKHSLVIADQAGLDKTQSFPLGPSYYTLLAWSPDGKVIVFQDNHLSLYSIALEGAGKGTIKKIDTSKFRAPFTVSFSQDSRWLAYNAIVDNVFAQVRIHEFATGKNTPVTDGLSNADNPVFAGSDYLYFTASINTGPSVVGLDMSSQERPVRDGIYALVLAADGKSPMAPRTADEEEKKDPPKDDAKPDAAKAEPAKDAAKPADGKTSDAKPAAPAAPKGPKPVKIDFAGLQDRVVALPVPERNYDSLRVASDGALFWLERRAPGVSNEPPEAESSGSGELYRFNFEERKAKSIKQGVQGFDLSADGKKMLLRYNRGKLEIADANEKLDAKPIDTSGVTALINPREEWKHIFNETWWMQKEFFYDANLHGLDWNAVKARYEPLVAHVQRREDLNELMREMIGELQVAHNNVGGGDEHREKPSNTGVLGADFAVENNRYRIKTIYRADRWNPFMKAPLGVAGLGVKEGDYILSINGRNVTASENLYAFLENTANKQVTLSVGADPAGKGAKNIVVQPVANDQSLRQWHWIEKNRQAVQEKTGGRVAYVYLPDTAGDGYKHFNRMFFAQVDKEALIVDDRRNSGGQAANYVTDVLSRKYLSGWKDRDGSVFETPGGAIYGPKAMLIDQDAGSGGDFLPYAFKRHGLGPLIGKRTWGGLIGIAANPPLIDGGGLTVPFFRFFTPEREWRIENEGVSPDIEVELDPIAYNQGRDTQLEAAIANVMDQLKTHKPIDRKVPPAPAKLGQ
ncbi:MAG: PD40 domain-containing protein [Betaproteobacteria bacterium]|nr:PD40 domain-containing protein [Betaproteobacteria bacterium]